MFINLILKNETKWILDGTSFKLEKKNQNSFLNSVRNISFHEQKILYTNFTKYKP